MARRYFLTLCITGLILPIATWAETGSQIEIHYAPQENLETVDVQEIGRAELSIDMAAYVLSDKEIIEALTDAAERDVVIRLYLDKSQFAEHGPVRGGLIEPRNGSLRFCAGAEVAQCQGHEGRFVISLGSPVG